MTINVISHLKTFKRGEIDLDQFLFCMNDIYELSHHFIEFNKLVCVLFNSQAAVERSFSINKECLVENLQEHSLIALRQVYDNIKELNFDLTK